MSILRIFFRYFLYLLVIGLIAILVFLWNIGFFSTMPLLTLEVPDGPIEPHMYELRDLYHRGSGIDDGVAWFITDHADHYVEPTIRLIRGSLPASEDEDVALFFADMLPNDCRVKSALLERALSIDSHVARSMIFSTLHRHWDEVELFPESDSIVSARLIRFRDDPVIDKPPEAWTEFGSMQYQGFVDEHDSFESAIRFAALQLASKERVELLYWLEAVSKPKPSDDQVFKAISDMGSNDHFVLVEFTEGKAFGFLDAYRTWITEAELKHVSENCQKPEPKRS